MSGGVGSRFPIPNNVRKIIQDIREITGKQHSDDDIYAVLKECSMDPNETAQKLLYLGLKFKPSPSYFKYACMHCYGKRQLVLIYFNLWSRKISGFLLFFGLNSIMYIYFLSWLEWIYWVVGTMKKLLQVNNVTRVSKAGDNGSWVQIIKASSMWLFYIYCCFIFLLYFFFLNAR